MYRAKKFTARHRWPLSAAALVIIALAAGVVATAIEARRANRHLAQVRELSGRLLFQVHDAVESLQGATRARELLATTSNTYLDGLSASVGNDPAFLRWLIGLGLDMNPLNGDRVTQIVLETINAPADAVAKAKAAIEPPAAPR